MATVSASPSISSYTIIKPHKNPSISSTNFSCFLPIRPQSTQSCISITNSYPNSFVSLKRLSNLNMIRVSAAEEDEQTVIPEQQEETEPTVSVPVSASDILTMFFQAEGTMSDAAIPSVTNALQETEGISDLKVQVHEGIASVELKKKTTVQATGVASNLVEIIQSSGFKLQALNLSFEDEVAFAT